MTDREWDKKLKIQTCGRDASHADDHHHPYEPTPYTVLERLAESGYIHRDNILIDYGCGKGRVSFFLNHKIKCRTIGLEYDAAIYQQALQNLESSSVLKNMEFVCIEAENYEIRDADCFYFFNPFTVEILRTVINRILCSYYENPRQMLLFFYYPDDEYLGYLLTGAQSANEICFLDEIDCSDLFAANHARERILIFEIPN